jgi:DinB family protein
MSDTNNMLVYTLTTSQQMINGFLADLTPSDYLHRPVPKANCAAWIVGHLTLTDRRALGRLDVKDLPEIPADFETRFARSEEAAGAANFGDVEILKPLFNAHRDRLIAAARSVTPEQLAVVLATPTPRFKTVGEMLHFMPLHVSMHCGQLSTIRRSLGRPPLILSMLRWSANAGGTVRSRQEKGERAHVKVCVTVSFPRKTPLLFRTVLLVGGGSRDQFGVSILLAPLI